MPKPCAKPLCAGEGHFSEDQCPGSDDEMHHCNDCGQLAWDNKGNYCERCGKYWCIDYQQVFIFFDCEKTECDEESMCYECFLADPSLWCSDPKCFCSSKRSEIQKEYLAFKAHGSWCGSHTLEKAEDKLAISVYRWNGEERGRVSCGKEEWLFDTMAKALDHAKALIKAKQAEGYSSSKPQQWGENPWGLLK